MPRHFFIVGAQRSGTTYLYRLLDSHPDITMAQPIKPEPKFFLLDRLYQHGLDYYYQTFFEQRPAGQVLGEKSTSYFESEKAARRIAATLPDSQILIILRDPVERAISNYWFSVNNGLEPLPLADAIYQEDDRRENYDHERISASPYAYMQRGRYMDYIEIYQRHFPPAQIKIVLHEQLIGDNAVAQDLFAFLNVATDHVWSGREAVNASEKQTTEISDDLRHYMTAYFAESNARLAAYLNIDLDNCW